MQALPRTSTIPNLEGHLHALPYARISIDPPLVFLLMFGIYALSGPFFWYWLRRRPVVDNVTDDGVDEADDDG